MASSFGPQRGGGRDLWFSLFFLAAAIAIYAVPARYQTPIRDTIRSTVLRPVLAFQGDIARERGERVELTDVRAQRDSLFAVAAAQWGLAQENRDLRRLLGLRDRAPDDFVPAEMIPMADLGVESTFLVTVGSADGVGPGAAVIAPSGLVGVLRDVEEHRSQGVDWTHPEFRAGAMTADGDSYGMVEPRRGRFREEDALALVGTPFHNDIPAGTRVVTSGRGGVFPRGVPLGRVEGIEEADTGWRKSYLLRPTVRIPAVSHVLVTRLDEETARLRDYSTIWAVPAPPDTATTPGVDDDDDEEGP
ncbi:MAG TPA: rod shape-determining protein MreC [Longimicrobiales bacterium]|nr:rod shape-determining protein MreC [Longimicrobiales bacterium]